ncbi:hypothetical protein ACFLV7_10135 [Chloroflexota bacterium]
MLQTNIIFAAVPDVINSFPNFPSSGNPSISDPSEIIHVPDDVSNIQNAINQISDGDIIEISSGVYQPPSQGYTILQLNKDFTIRAAVGATVIFDGQGKNPLFNIQQVPTSPSHSVNFERIIFSNGFTKTDGNAAITINKMNVTFVDCIFQNNRKNRSGGSTHGGAIYSAYSNIYCFGCQFNNNISEDGGAGIGARETNIYIHNSIFSNNKTLDACSTCVSNGAAINHGSGILRITNSRFEGNESAGHGAAIWVIGEWDKPETNAIISNSTFINNKIKRSTPNPGPIEGGALVVEDYAHARIYNSRFIKNSASIGGAMSIFRSKIEIYKSTFLGNRATDTIPTSGFGGTINFNPHDRSDYASMRIEDSYIQGRYDDITTVAQRGGGISTASGSTNPYPELYIKRVVLNDLDVTTPAGQGNAGLGGAVGVGKVDFKFEDSIIMNSDAVGPEEGFGGGILFYPLTKINIDNAIIAFNSADKYGGGLFAQASDLNVSNSTFFKNEISPGQSESISTSYGAAIFTAPEDSSSTPITGEVAVSKFVENIGLAIFDDDRYDGPIDDVRYNQNHFYENSFEDNVYKSAITSASSVPELNDLVISRASGVPSTDKSQNDNIELSSSLKFGKIMAVPPIILPNTAAGDQDSQTKSYISYVWNGSTATLNSTPLSNQAWYQETSTAGMYTLSVDGSQYNTSIPQGADPNLSVSITPGNPNATLQWDLIDGSFLDIVMDQGMSIPSSPNGSVQIPSGGNIYYIYTVTEEGGVVETVNTNTDGPFLVFLPVVLKE